MVTLRKCTSWDESGDQLISLELCSSSRDAPDKVQDILNEEDPGIGNQIESLREKTFPDNFYRG